MLAGSNSEERINGDLANMYRQGKGPLKRNFSTLSWFLCQSFILIRKTEQHFFKLVMIFNKMILVALWSINSDTTYFFTDFQYRSVCSIVSIMEKIDVFDWSAISKKIRKKTGYFTMILLRLHGIRNRIYKRRWRVRSPHRL